MITTPIKPKFFRSQEQFRAWLVKNHDRKTELWIGYWKKASGKVGLTYKPALDEALCFGWIDGIARPVDEDCYMQRWTPRRKSSNWSLLNTRRYRQLDAAGLVSEPGRAAFARRKSGPRPKRN